MGVEKYGENRSGHPAIQVRRGQGSPGKLGIQGFTISHVLDHDALAVRKEFYRGGEYLVDLPKVKLELLVSSDRADDVVEALAHSARTTIDGDDGAILIYEVADAVRIRTGQRLEFALA